MSLVLGLEHSVLGLERVCPRKGCPWPWPRIFFCVLGLGLELCVLDSTSAVQRKILLAKLNHYGIRGVVNNFFESYLTNRSQAVIIHDNHSSKSIIDIGVPRLILRATTIFTLYK